MRDVPGRRTHRQDEPRLAWKPGHGEDVGTVMPPFPCLSFPSNALHKTTSPERKGESCPPQRLGLHLTPPKVQHPLPKISLSHCLDPTTMLCSPGPGWWYPCGDVPAGTRGQHSYFSMPTRSRGKGKAEGTDHAHNTKQAKSHLCPPLSHIPPHHYSPH